ncbi:MAG: efflux RND transporter periplasmic adaptor subunit [Opitutaceae bacterium]|nr:efflux RND transporter periplasmic adaptor subunit [Verrucomicrobiales bacterium]
MKPQLILAMFLVAALAGAGGWWAARRGADSHAITGQTNDARKVLRYQSPMHPWIKAEKPGKCTICGMDLVPVFEGESGISDDGRLIMLSTNSITVLNVETAEIKRQPLRRTLRVAGTIDDDDSRHRILSAYLDGRIDELFVNHVGAEVTAGQPLATLYSPMLLTAEREYVALVQQKQVAALQGEQGRMTDAAAQRLLRLGLTREQIVSLPDKAESDRHTRILAPINGTVVLRNVYAGQYVKEGDKLFEIADFSKMWFQFDAYERDLAWLQTGQSIDVTTPSAPGKVFTGKIAFIDPNLSDQSRSAKVRVELDNPLIDRDGQKRRELLHKIYAEGIVTMMPPELLTVPRSAVLSPAGQPIVYLDKGGGAFEPRSVKLGRAGDDAWEVLDGLAEGERVVTSGNMLIDAQAQLNQSSRSPSVSQPVTNTVTVSNLTPAQTKALQEFLAIADAVTQALAADDLNRFNDQAARLHGGLPPLLTAFDTGKEWHPLLSKVEAVAHFGKAVDLMNARKAFHPFSSAVVDLVRHLRTQDKSFGEVRIFQCPMVKEVFPGAPKSAQWLQLDAKIRNPYFGAAMIDCGAEVKP